MLTKQLAHFQVPISSGQCEGRYSFLVRKKKANEERIAQKGGSVSTSEKTNKM